MKIFKRKLKKFLLYLKAIEGFGPYICILDELLNRERTRMITIGRTNFYVRTNTPDLKVAISCLYEKEYDYLRCSIPKFIIDAGAHIGTSAIFFAKKYPNAKIIAVEPEKSNFHILLKNTSNYKNIFAINAAIWGYDDRKTLQSRFTGSWGYTIAETQNHTESTEQEINCITIKSIMEKYHIDSIDLLKMDIEGSEKNVLEHSSTWIDSVAVMTIELHERICLGCERAFYLATKDFEILEKHGEKFTVYKNEPSWN